MSKWVTGEPIYVKFIRYYSDSTGKPRLRTVESKDAWEVTETAKEVMEKIQEADNG